MRFVYVASDVCCRMKVGSRRDNISITYFYHSKIVVGQSMSIIARNSQPQTFLGHYWIAQRLQSPYILHNF